MDDSIKEELQQSQFSLDDKRMDIKAILESNLCLGLAPNSEYSKRRRPKKPNQPR